jgi:hypothetical protein
VSVSQESLSRPVVFDPRLGARFIATIVARPDFQSSGVHFGGDDELQFAVIDPLSHPLGVWKKQATNILSYSRSAQDLDAVVFTNGPLMGKRLRRSRKVTRGAVPWLFARSAGVGLFGGIAATFGTPAQYYAGAGGAALGIVHAWTQSFANWVPCGRAQSRCSSFDDRRDFDGEGKRHAWLGRFSSEFSSYRIGYGDLPTGVSEGLGGLIMLVQNFEARTKSVDEPTYDGDFALLHRSTGVVAWALVPLPSTSVFRRGSVARQTKACDGVIVVAGSRDKLNCEDMAVWLCSIGARDAVATDLSRCSMMGAGNRFSIGPPPPHRQAMQLYGLYCRTSRDVR